MERIVKIVCCLTLICISTSFVHGSDAKALCRNDWHPYEDEKCVKLFKTLAHRNQAEIICNQNGATLVTIKSVAEQKFLSELVLKSSASNNAWIGAERRPGSETEFDWNDGSAVKRYTNWAVGRPSADARRTCVQMQTDLSRRISDLEWADIGCTTGDWFICQKLQSWPFEYLQEAILDARREMEYNVHIFTDEVTALTTMLNDANTELKDLHENPIPIGFVYVQLPDQPEPWRLWWLVEWTEVTDQYAGLFFRAAGEGSAEFGTIQEENSPRLTSVNGRLVINSPAASVVFPVNGGVSPTVSVGATGGASHWGMSFTASSGEVRPRNTAMRIWMRTN